MPLVLENIQKRAGLWLALFFAVIVLFQTPAADSKTTAASAGLEKNSDKNKALIEQAYSIMAQKPNEKSRQKALELLLSAVPPADAKRPFSVAKDISAAIEKIATLFLSDHAQQLFELGLSLKASDPALALNKMQEALKLESDNLFIQIEIFRIQGAGGDCGVALSGLQKVPAGYFVIETLALLRAQLQVCAGQYVGFEGLRPADYKKSKLAPCWEAIELERLFKSGKFEEGLSISLANASLDPEIYFWRGQTELQLKKPPEESYQSYVASCRNISGRQSRELSAEFRLCRHVTEVETYLKKSHNPSP
jgi:hypothetical protein